MVDSKISLDNVSPNVRYIVELYPYVYAASEKTGLSLELMLAQGAQETGWGKSVLPGTNNMFNIKSSKGWNGDVYELKGALEYNKDGTTRHERSKFRVYSSIEESVQDRINFLSKNRRYSQVFSEGVKGNIFKEARALQDAGYAGDNPYYAKALIKVAGGSTMKTALEFARKYHGY